MSTSLAIPVFELKPFARLRFYKELTLKAGEHSSIKLPEINNGNIIVQLVNQPGNPHAGTNVIPSGRNAYLSVLHSSVKVTDLVKPMPALDGSGVVRTATAFAKVKDSLWEVYIENKSQVNSEHFPDSELFFILVEYSSSYPIKTKTIPMSFWQRAFDEFWNEYKPIENIKIDYNHDKYGDQYSVGSILLLLKEINRLKNSPDLFIRSQAMLLKAKYNIADVLLDDPQTKVLSKYYKYFNDLNFINSVNDIIHDARGQFIGRIQKIGFENPNDAEFRNQVYVQSDRVYNFVSPFFLRNNFPQRYSNKVILTLKQEIANIYNVNASLQGVPKIVFKLPELSRSIGGSEVVSVKIRDININNLLFSTIKNTTRPGFKINFSIETQGREEIYIKGVNDDASIDITSLKIDPTISLVSLPSVEESSLNKWGKNYALDLRLNFSMTPNVIIEYPRGDVDIDFNGDDLVKFDVDVEWVRTDLNTLMNTTVRVLFENYLNEDKHKVIEYLLGKVYPILDIKQVNDNMHITYVADKEDDVFNQIKQNVPFIPSPQNNLSKIDHIIVLMMENRSFDHMLG
ncbi:MAG TPA: hypothetical protein VJU78_18040, partial [Chitinophagaceae bacterium]|nr:hypothetical protein [Chitinophagaceae bacterium]